MTKPLTIEQTAAALGLRPGGVFALIYRKKLRATKVGRAYQIEPADVEKAKARNRKSEKPKRYADRADFNRQRRERLANDPAYREKINKSQRERARKRYAASEEYRKKMSARTLKWVKNRRETDPVAAERERKRNRDRMRQSGANAKERAQ